jgi:hypothetical protein
MVYFGSALDKKLYVKVLYYMANKMLDQWLEQDHDEAAVLELMQDLVLRMPPDTLIKKVRKRLEGIPTPEVEAMLARI